MQKTMAHPNAIGNGSLAAPFTERVDIAAATDSDALDCLYLSYQTIIPPNGTPAVQPTGATVKVDQDGAGANKARITLAIKNVDATGSANSDVEFNIDCDGTANGDWSSGNVTVLDLKGIMDAINKDTAGGTNGGLLEGFKCWIGPGGMYDMIVTGALALQEESAEYVLGSGTTGRKTGFLKRDMSIHSIDSDYLLYWRIGMPEPQDRGMFKLLDLWGAIGTDTGCTVYVVRDDVLDYVIPTGTWATDFANHELLEQVAAGSLPAGSGAANWLNHNPVECGVTRGPIVVIVKGDTDFDTQTVNLAARLQAVSF